MKHKTQAQVRKEPAAPSVQNFTKISNIWQWEKQLKTGLSKECAIKITAGLPELSVGINVRATENAGSAFLFPPFLTKRREDIGSFLFNSH